ncbi:MAG: hypothetical protein AAF567_14045 [Actinomycetota bacterium]
MAGFVLASIVSRVLRQSFESRKGRIAQLAPAVTSLSFSLLLVTGLLVALGFVQPDSVAKLRDDTIDYLPRALSALIVVILGGVIGTIVSTATRESIGRTMGRAGEKAPTVVKGVITAFAAILAASQLGIDTTVINIVVAGGVFALALAFAMVVGLGSRPVATEIASGRALRRVVSIGDEVATGELSGTVVQLHPTSIELDTDGTHRLVPYTELAGPLTVTRHLGESSE